jgi:hypothetical protein
MKNTGKHWKTKNTEKNWQTLKNWNKLENIENKKYAVKH